MSRSKTHAWLELLRAPNLLTVVGDPLAGYFLAGGAAAGAAALPVALAPAGASLLLYAAGLIQNDVLDLAEDARERPNRPLPSRRVSLYHAAAAFMAMLGGAMGLSLLVRPAGPVVAVMLIGAIAAYNTFTKRVPIIGPLNMGLCRGLSVMLGAAAVGWQGLATPLPLVAAGALTLYIAAVTALAARETLVPPRRGRVYMLPLFAAVVGLAAVAVAALLILPPQADVASVGVRHVLHAAVFAFAASLCLWRVASTARSLKRSHAPGDVQRGVGELLGALLAFQAALLAMAQAWWAMVAAAILLALWPINSRLRRSFYAS